MANPSTPSIYKGRPTAINAVGTKVTTVAGIDVDECGNDGPVRQIKITLTNMPLTITDALAYASQKLYDWPTGRINVIDAVGNIAFTTTSAIASTLNSGATLSWGLGSAAASNLTLATTMMNFLPGSGESVKTVTSSTTINVAGSTGTGFLAAVSAAHLAAIVDGTSTAADLYLNVAVPTNTEIDADATVTVNATFYLTYIVTGVTS